MYDHAATATSTDHVDLLIGAGVSESAPLTTCRTSCRRDLRDSRCPRGPRRTWDLFRYPGIRSTRPAHLRLLAFEALDQREGHRRRAGDQGVHPRDR